MPTMRMDRDTLALIRQLQGGLSDASQEGLARMVKEVQEEAMAEARTILKWLMVQAILDGVTGGGTLADTGFKASPAGREDPAPTGLFDVERRGAPSGAQEDQEGARNGGKGAPEKASPAGREDPAPTGFSDAERRGASRGAQGDGSEVPGDRPEASSDGDEAQDGSAGGQDELDAKAQLCQEIEAIRRKIAENERFLSGTGGETAESQAEEVPDPPPVSPDPGNESSYAIYVYGVVGPNGAGPLDGLPERGIDPAWPVCALPGPCTGDGGQPAIQAVVSRVSLDEFGQENLEENLDDMRWLEARVREHQHVLDSVTAGHTLIPMRFCTIYHGEERVREMLAQHQADFLQALGRLKDKKEWGVKVYCDSRILSQKVSEVSDRVKEMEAEIATKSTGVGYFMRKKLDEIVASEVERIQDDRAQQSHDCLSAFAVESVVNRLQGQEMTGRSEPMVLNGAYLVAEEQLEAFGGQVASLQEQNGHLGFCYEMSGPWPAYNFVAVDLGESKEDVGHE